MIMCQLTKLLEQGENIDPMPVVPERVDAVAQKRIQRSPTAMFPKFVYLYVNVC